MTEFDSQVKANEQGPAWEVRLLTSAATGRGCPQPQRIENAESRRFRHDLLSYNATSEVGYGSEAWESVREAVLAGVYCLGDSHACAIAHSLVAAARDSRAPKQAATGRGCRQPQGVENAESQKFRHDLLSHNAAHEFGYGSQASGSARKAVLAGVYCLGDSHACAIAHSLVAAAGDSRAPQKADGGCKMGARGGRKTGNRPPLPAIVRLVRLCPAFFRGGGSSKLARTKHQRSSKFQAPRMRSAAFRRLAVRNAAAGDSRAPAFFGEGSHVARTTRKRGGRCGINSFTWALPSRKLRNVPAARTALRRGRVRGKC